ncbi:OmpW/AlkL family protein [Aquirhabdus parva]|uniref:OmpW family protein n=1 Tax=Aquirhabdus parva TaxID=2283318 RepID=A0A345P566_9GAMM|nr:OmpW family outer membrane protein [Aquirhabdus parva]AXI02425.1 OmpW family protein [Aquirhabdus parva]
MKLRNIVLTMAIIQSINAAHAMGAGDTLVNLGWINMEPNEVSQPLLVTAMGHTNSIVGSGTSLRDANTGALTVSYFFTDHLAVEMVLGIPPTVHLDGTGSIAKIGELGKAKANVPTVESFYYFGTKDSALRPFLGVGVSYAKYTGIELTQHVADGEFLASSKTGTALVGPTIAHIDSNFFPIFTGGLLYQITPKWSARVSASYIPLRLDATLNTQAPVGTVTSEVKSSLNTLMTFFSVGYTF